jgi:hypothetical protein
MAITAVSATYLGAGPSKTGQIVVRNENGLANKILYGTATVTGDGTDTTAVINYIDGTQLLNAIPAGILATVCGGDDTAGATIVKAVDNGDKAGFTVTFAPAPANTKTVKIAFQVLPVATS